LRLWATHSFPMFRAHFAQDAAGNIRTADLSQLLTVRISNFGGAVQNLVPGAALHNESLRTVAIGTSSRLRYLRFMVAVWCRSHTYRSPIELIEAKTIQCEELEAAATQTYVEADGELLGTLPARIEVIPDALTLLVPARTASRFSAVK
jgi:diacylglycerol kinase (ATP)